jgi:hypothetical protein
MEIIMLLTPTNQLTRRFFSTLFIALLGLLCAAHSSSAQTVTFSGRQLQTGGQYQVASDFNADGKMDLAVAGLKLEVLMGNGDGSFQPSVKYAVANGFKSIPQGITTADFNGDNKLDLALSLNDPIEVGLFLGNGDGTFQPLNRFPTNAVGLPTSLVAADFNRDGRLDLMTSDEYSCNTGPCVITRTVTLFSGNGDGTFQTPQQIDVGTAPTKLAVGDFDRNGFVDVTIAAGLGKVFILLGNGDGTFRELPEIPIMAQVDNTDVAVGDFNGDTVQDLVIAIDAESKFGILLGNGDGTFAALSIVVDVDQQRPASLTLGDINRDGKQDVVIGHSDCCSGALDMGAFGVMFGNGNGTFQPIARYIVPANGRIQLSGWNPVVADFNGDSKPDVALSFTNNIGGSTFGTLIATNTTAVAPARLALGTMSASPASLIGGTNTELNIPLAPGAVAPAGNLAFTVTTSNNTVAYIDFSQTSPPFLMVAGMTNLRFKIGTNQVTTPQKVTITVNNKNLGSRSVSLTVTPPTEPLAVGSISLQPPALFGGNDSVGVVNLATGYVAPAGGSLVTLTNDNPSLVTMPKSVTIPAGKTSVEFPIQTWTTGTTTPVTISASYGNVTKSAVLTVSAPSQPVPISTVTLTPQTVVGGSNQGVRVLVTLAANAPDDSATIMLTSSRPDVVALPRSISIPFSFQNSAFHDFIAAAVTAPTQVTITATYGGSSKSAILTVTPPATNAPTMSSFTLNPASVAGGSSSQGTITLSAAASAPTTISLTSSSAIANVPASVTVPAGASVANFTVNTISVSSQITATISATLNGISRNATLTLTPTGDTVSITRAEYTVSTRVLRIEATSTRTNATLQALVTSSGQIIGTLTNQGGGKYSAELSWSVNPQNITVKSSFGGTATRAVTAK